MNRLYLRRDDIAGIFLMAVVLAVIVFVLLFFPQTGQQNFGFGPEWQCARMGGGDPICVRLVENDEAGKFPP
ncbi:hypothetical protein CK218_24960 [Mesorhizobium sp. WSM3879]|uniref:hypothetical protein n=1 Tax=unclassified Mesorhizobium TaxID=325217 RepID=UPI000BAF5ECA|nr:MULTISPECIES: hypothetical protein [unclassified Mesorhizobium]PBB78326.1 hypothetical protein CK218_24960 [Mesorhizobium sp. WSM3879]RUW51022.1 hypothetical protein EOA32_17355 [Mesorhizobium sp. M1A.F.Ca.ET.072.01.1.1]